MPVKKRIKPAKKRIRHYINLNEAAAVVLLSFPGKSGTFKEIADAIHKKNLFTERTRASLAKELSLKAAASSGKFKKWFSYTKPDVLSLKIM